MIAIIDYGLGNLMSVKNALNRLEIPVEISSDPRVLEKSKALILPGVGAFDNGMENLQELKLIETLNKKVMVKKTPILGICLGMQLFTKSSEEGQMEGLGWIDAETVRFDFGENRIPGLPAKGPTQEGDQLHARQTRQWNP